MRKFVLCLVVAVAMTSCGVTNEQLESWKLASAELTGQIGDVRTDLVLVTDEDERARLEGWLDKAQPILESMNAAIAEAETPEDVAFNLGETALTAAASFFPPAGGLLLLLRAWRRSRKNLGAVFSSVAAGGGVANPDAAKSALAKDPAAMAAFLKFKESLPK